MDPIEEPRLEDNTMPQAKPEVIYPTLTITHIQNPNRWYAIPIISGLIKWIFLIPAYIILFGYAIITGVLVVINSAYVLVTGRYWPLAYRFLTQYLCYSVKTYCFFVGLTDTYPGFSAALPPEITIDFPYPENPNRFFAIPIFGGLVRLIFLIPYYVFTAVIKYASWLGVLGSSLVVLFDGRYPESTYEFARDYQRLSLSSALYLAGASDHYPSFTISWNHRGIKIFLIILALIMLLSNISHHSSNNHNQRTMPYRQRYYQQPNSFDTPNYQFAPPGGTISTN